MGRILNLQILGHPLNILHIIILAAIFWIAVKVIKSKTAPVAATEQN